ncbi:phosphate ABC transporter permease PtsA [Saccharobesus litoralis]|uniref:Phosphate transport system permease protein PstA n=1 Tax=Saccharobesus litoralis TaxID=2172099 RepID=A0A2S0VMT1_9ALTE|nr:phosphate ABC transporter permease PstA [Saccharobesus litoralis]AWB65515.1 phosphate ABC transporter permease PtsA [Saccharobesus litoralis]
MMNKWFKSGSPWIWMTAGAVSISLISVIGLLLLIAWRGLVYFWPSDIIEFSIEQNNQKYTVIGEVYDSEEVPTSRLRQAGVELTNYQQDTVERFLIKTGNREFVELDFRWILQTDIQDKQAKPGLAKIERIKNGNFYGYIHAVVEDGQTYAGEQKLAKLDAVIERAVDLNEDMLDIQNSDIGAINYQLENIRLEQRAIELKGKLTDAVIADFAKQKSDLQAEYLTYEKSLNELRVASQRDKIIVRDMRGELVEIPAYQILDIQFPNDMNGFSKAISFVAQIGKFISDDPREANTEGGVFPAIFGTVFMVLLMAVIVTPFGVVAAIYLHEYAAKNAITKIVRISVINLAGVPSIVYGVFGLGFFVYMLGGNIDALFYPEAAPNPTFGTPGVIWSALTLAILTLPVVIVSTEEGLSRIPSALRQGSLALGATKAETLWRIVIPMASPAIMTGLILAVARAAGEVAPLMLVGVVKMAPTLPLDGNFPFIHLDRKFMHLGFHIYDVGFQSPNVEAARPLVYATAFLLVTVIVTLNITAIGIRNHLREKYKSLEH